MAFRKRLNASMLCIQICTKESEKPLLNAFLVLNVCWTGPTSLGQFGDRNSARRRGVADRFRDVHCCVVYVLGQRNGSQVDVLDRQIGDLQCIIVK